MRSADGHGAIHPCRVADVRTKIAVKSTEENRLRLGIERRGSEGPRRNERLERRIRVVESTTDLVDLVPRRYGAPE